MCEKKNPAKAYISYRFQLAPLAQTVERGSYELKVTGSIPVWSNNIFWSQTRRQLILILHSARTSNGPFLYQSSLF